jgi:hypothetical protein
LDEYSQWESQKNDKRKSYYEFVKELIIDPLWEDIINAKEEIVAVEDHPLNEAPTSKWSTYFSELNVLEQIDKDARRTLPDIGFFQFPIIYSNKIIEENKKLGNVEPFLGISISKRRSLFSRLEHKIKDDEFGARSHKMPTSASNSQTDVTNNSNNDEKEFDLHWEALERILFIYAKLNPGIGYIQGMNEILGPLYYVLANDVGIDQLHAEADSFYLFTNLMSIFRDHFIKNLDSVGARSRVVKNEMTMENIVKLRPQDEPQSKKIVGKRIIGNETGIGQSMLRLYKRIELRDREVYMHLRSKKILPAYFAFRWLSVLLSREFNLPDLIRIWDSLFSDINLDILNETQMESRKRDGRFDFLIEFCCSMVICVRRQIIKGSTSDIIKLLQNYPIQDVNTVLQLSYKLFERPLRPRVTPEQIQKRQEYLKQKRLQQQQQQIRDAKVEEVTNQIKNSISNIETKLQSLDFSKMFSQVSEKINSITSPIADIPTYSYFKNPDEQDNDSVDDTPSNSENSKVSNNNDMHTTSSTTTTTTTTKSKESDNKNKNINASPNNPSASPTRNVRNNSHQNSTNYPNKPKNTNQSQTQSQNQSQSPHTLQKKSSFSVIASTGIADLNNAYETASNRISGWFKSGSSALTNAFNTMMSVNDSDSNNGGVNHPNNRPTRPNGYNTNNNNNNNNSNPQRTGQQGNHHRHLQGNNNGTRVASKKNSSGSSMPQKKPNAIQQKLSEPQDNTPIMKSATHSQEPQGSSTSQATTTPPVNSSSSSSTGKEKEKDTAAATTTTTTTTSPSN